MQRFKGNSEQQLNHGVGRKRYKTVAKWDVCLCFAGNNLD
jgi:hypothetical protein